MKTCFLIVLSMLFFSSYAFGATFTVNSNADTSDVNTSDGVCSDASGNCTLRAAIEQANALASGDVINFAANINSISLASQLLISNNGSLTIIGRGANLLTVAGNGNNNRVLQSDAATLIITDLTVSGGRIVFPNTGSGAGMLVNGGAVTLQRVVFNDNVNSNGRQMAGDGGGVNFIGGNHVVQNSTFSNNTASGRGGGIANNGGTLTVSNSTFSGNLANYSNGGGIFSEGNLDLFNVTISSNVASTSCISFCLGQGGGLSHAAGALRIANTIVSGNTTFARGSSPIKPEIDFSGGTLASLGNNFIGDSAGDSTDTGNAVSYQPTDIRDIPPQLAPLGNYGGTTPTRALLSNSPAINAGNDANAPPTDQRGVARVNASDIGAYEYNGSNNFTISGRVTTDGTNGFGGVTVTLSGSATATVTTNSNGEYIFTGLSEGGNYTVTPSFPNIVFSPSSATFNNLSGSAVANFRPQCVYSINPSSAAVSANGGSGSFTLTTSAGCSWTATSNDSFISVSNTSGSGSATIVYTVGSNPGMVRTGTITVAGLTFTLTQAAFPVFTINNVSLFEGNSGTTAFVFTVTLSGSNTQTATAYYSTVNGTAVPPTDYQATSGGLSFAPGETSKTITILVNGDTTVEPDESFSVNLTSTVNATIGNSQGIGTIRNDDGAAKRAFDFDGDGKSDVSVFRPSTGFWYTSQNPALNYGAYQFGQSGDKIVPADYDGDGKTDIAVNRNGNWYIQRSSQGFTGIQFGDGNDIPVPADYDGDGNADIAVFRPSNGTWYLLQSSAGFKAIALGLGTDKPVPGDYNGDGKAEIAVFRPSNGYWYLSTNPATNYGGVAFGQAEDKLVPADYDGDGKTDIAVFRPSNGMWYLLRSSLGFTGIQFGLGTDTPVPADYDGDGKTDIAVNRNGNWYLLQSSAGFTGIQFGVSEDKSTPGSFVR